MKHKRLLSIVLSAAMLIGSAALPQSEFAQSTDIVATAASVNTATSGKCGDELNWTLKKGVLTISGKGKMTDYNSYNESPFYGRTDITSVVIKKGVTSIGDRAFANCQKIKSISIADSVKSIGYCSFIRCCGIPKITLPDSITSIGKMCFANCYALKSITLSNSLKRIEDLSFIDCTKLNDLVIPYGVTQIGWGVFQVCSSLSNVKIPPTVQSIDSYAFFNCNKLNDVTVPSSVRVFNSYCLGFKNDENGNIVTNKRFTIYGNKGSRADTYAMHWCFRFVERNTVIPKSTRYSGNDRAQTAAVISSGMYKTADTVIIATGFDFHDALAAVPLASAYDAPLLLADRDNLSKTTLNEIKRLKAKNVIVVASSAAKDPNGNDAAIKKIVYSQLSGYNVTKLTGNTYYETAKKVAEALGKKTRSPESLFITTDKGYADTLTASPIAAIKNSPILYVDPKAKLANSTTAYLKKVKASVKNVYIIGGVNAVSKDVETSVLNILGKNSATRFAGNDRYETCVKINNHFKGTLAGNSVCVAKGYNFPDALAGGVFAAKHKAPLFLADKLDDKATISKKQSDYLYAKNPSKLYIFGGETAVPAALVKTISRACV